MSVPEIRRLLWRLVLAVPQTIRDILAWPQWRRWHQTVAKYYHYKRREAVADAVAAQLLNYDCSTRPGSMLESRRAR